MNKYLFVQGRAIFQHYLEELNFDIALNRSTIIYRGHRYDIRWAQHFLQDCRCVSKVSDQPAHPCSLISHRCPPEDTLDPWLPTECPAKHHENIPI